MWCVSQSAQVTLQLAPTQLLSRLQSESGLRLSVSVQQCCINLVQSFGVPVRNGDVLSRGSPPLHLVWCRWGTTCMSRLQPSTFGAHVASGTGVPIKSITPHHTTWLCPDCSWFWTWQVAGSPSGHGRRSKKTWQGILPPLSVTANQAQGRRRVRRWGIYFLTLIAWTTVEELRAHCCAAIPGPSTSAILGRAIRAIYTALLCLLAFALLSCLVSGPSPAKWLASVGWASLCPAINYV